jgi:hypothetical protein
MSRSNKNMGVIMNTCCICVSHLLGFLFRATETAVQNAYGRAFQSYTAIM